MRERFFTPRLRFKTLEDLNGWLADKCVAYAKAHKHPDQGTRTVWEVRGGADQLHSLCRPLRRLPLHSGLRVEDLHSALRQQ